MVHLNRVQTEAEIAESQITEGIDLLKFDAGDEEDDYTATVYGSKWAAQDLPRHCMPDQEMPPQVYAPSST
jgi:glutamate decarboxylase